MIQYILEILAFQILFLIVYDLFLKGETFFQWNRFYLIGTFILSLVLPWVKIEAFKTTVSQDFIGYPAYIWQLDGVVVGATETKTSWFASLPTEHLVFGIGALLATVVFGFKLFRIFSLKNKGTIRIYKDFTKVVVHKSELAFSFFKHIFMGEQIKKENEANIIAHELVHIKQRHSLDLLFFEIMRIAFWFNPLVYVYQKRVSELHEFIADAIVAKKNKKEQYQLLLAEVFQTQSISFINQFFKKSLIKKRIVMLSKSKSKKIYQFKYLLLVPLVLGMLVYTSCEQENAIETNDVEASTNEDVALISSIENELKDSSEDDLMKYAFGIDIYRTKENLKISSIKINKNETSEGLLSKEDFFKKQIAHKLLMPKVYKTRPFKHPDDILKEIPYPSSQSYKSYVARNKAFEDLDENLKVSIPRESFSLQSINKLKNYPQDYQTISVNTVSKLTADEIRTINRIISKTKQDKYVSLVIFDKNHAFLVNKKLRDANLSSKSDKVISEKTNESQVPFAIVDEVPIFPGCEDAEDKKACFQEKIQSHIRKNFNYPKEAQELGIQGRVSLVFIISADGNIENIRKRGPHELLENEAVRIIERLPQMQPGKQNGEAVDVPFSIPVTFRLADSSTNDKIKSKNEVPIISVPFAVVDEVPVFPGCENAIDKKACFQESIQRHIRKNFNYPKEAQEFGIQGRVSIVFIIQDDGNIENIRMRGPHKLLEAEALRIIKRLPQMTPGKQDGKAVDVPFSIPITFRLQDSSNTPIPFPKMAMDIDGVTPEIKKAMLRYNTLVEERSRLLKSTSKENPIVVNLDEQLTVLRLKIREELKIEVQKMNN